MNEAALLQNSLWVGGLLFALGLIGVLTRRNVITMFLCAEMMLQGVSLSFVAWGRFHNNWSGQVFVIFILTVAACEAGLALAMFLLLFKHSGSLDVTSWQELREENQPPFLDRQAPPADEPDKNWPVLTPAGAEPETDPSRDAYRSKV